MAPGYRANNQSRRANRGLVDHDIFEGLPVRIWKRDMVTVAPPVIAEPTTQKDKWDAELPWGMPKDSHMLPQHSIDILRLARSGLLYKKRPAVAMEEEDLDTDLNEKSEKKDDLKEKGFNVKTWKALPRHLEGPETEYLAKRRKGLRSPATLNVPSAGPAMTKTTVRRTDAAGNSYVEDVVVPEGQAIEGEVIAQVLISEPVSTLVGPNAGLQKRRPLPPKRRTKGRGLHKRRNKPVQAPTSAPAGVALVKPEQPSAVVEGQTNGTTVDNIKSEFQPAENTNAVTPNGDNEDTELAGNDLSQVVSDEDGDDGDDGPSDEEGDEEGDDEQDEDPSRDEPDVPDTRRHESGTSSTAEFSQSGSGEALQKNTTAYVPASASGVSVESPLKQMSKPSLPQDDEPDLHDDSAEADGDDDVDDGLQAESFRGTAHSDEMLLDQEDDLEEEHESDYYTIQQSAPSFHNTHDHPVQNNPQCDDSTEQAPREPLSFNENNVSTQDDMSMDLEDIGDFEGEASGQDIPSYEGIEEGVMRSYEDVSNRDDKPAPPTSTADFVAEAQEENRSETAAFVPRTNSVPQQPIHAGVVEPGPNFGGEDEEGDEGSFEDLLGSLEHHLGEQPQDELVEDSAEDITEASVLQSEFPDEVVPAQPDVVVDESTNADVAVAAVEAEEAAITTAVADPDQEVPVPSLEREEAVVVQEPVTDLETINDAGQAIESSEGLPDTALKSDQEAQGEVPHDSTKVDEETEP